MGFGDIGGGVALDLMERDFFGGNAGGRLELCDASIVLGVVVTERLKKEVQFFHIDFSNSIICSIYMSL